MVDFDETPANADNNEEIRRVTQELAEGEPVEAETNAVESIWKTKYYKAKNKWDKYKGALNYIKGKLKVMSYSF